MFRFTIRNVLWLTVVVTMGIGWMKKGGQAEEEGLGDDSGSRHLHANRAHHWCGHRPAIELFQWMRRPPFDP